MISRSSLLMKQNMNLRSIPIRMKNMYSRGMNFLFKKNLLITNCISSGGFMFIGDLAQQEFEYEKKIISNRYDWARSGRMFAVGTLMGPLHHYYYLYLDLFLPKANVKTALQKILWDQLLASPLTIMFFYVGTGLLEGKTKNEINDEIGDKFKYTYLGDCLFWPPVQFINFYYLSSKYRVFYINFATMIFNVFLSYMKHNF